MKSARRISIALFAFLVMVSMACSLGQPLAPTPSPTPTPIPLPPTIVETIPPVGTELPIGSLLTIYFSEAMDRASVEAALSAQPEAQLVFSWVDDSILTLAPSPAFPADTKIVLTLAESARSKGGLAPLGPLTLNYSTPGLLRVSQVLPAPQADSVSPVSAVVVAFNQPVVALGADPASLPAGFSLEPAASGSGEWLNTSTYVFTPQPALAGGIDYTARVNPALKSLAGTSLDSGGLGTAWTFRTAPPQVLKITPPLNSRLALDQEFEISFNQPMDRASVESNLTLRASDGSLAAGQFTWNENGSSVTFKPSGLLARQTLYRLTVGQAARSNGGETLARDIWYEFETYGAFAFQNANIPNGSLRPTSESLTLFFTAPPALPKDVDPASLIRVSPELSDYFVSLDGSAMMVFGGFNPGETYTITLPAAMTDAWGQALGQDATFSFVEPDAFPSLRVGTYQPELFVRPDAPTVAVKAVNLNTIFVSRSEMTLDDYLRFGVDYNFQQAYSPASPETWEVRPGLPRNESQPVEISLNDGTLQTGLYFVQFDTPDSEFQLSRRTVVASNVNLTVKVSPTEALLWAVDLRTGKPVANASVRLYGSSSERLATGQTDDAGLWRGTLPEKSAVSYAVLGKPGDEQFAVASPNWASEIQPWNFGLAYDESGPYSDAYLYTDRPVYRPGDVVHLRGIVRELFDGRYAENSENRSYTLRLNGPSGPVDQLNASLGSFGTFGVEFTLPEQAAPGGYSIDLSTAEDQSVRGGSIFFEVADYRKPELNLSVDVSPAAVLGGSPLTGTVTIEYFFGAPAGDIPFEWALYRNPSSFYIPGYSTGLYDSDWVSLRERGFFGNQVASGSGRTNASGQFTLPLEGVAVTDTSELTLEITATESGGFPVSASHTLVAHPENFYIGIRPGSWFGQAGTAFDFDLQTVGWEQQPVSQPLTLEFKKVRWERRQGRFGETTYAPVYEPAESQTLSTDALGAAQVSFTPSKAGTYMLEASGGRARSQVLVWVGGAEDAAWPRLPFDRLTLTADRDNYKPGETAEIFIPNDLGDTARALLTTERGTFKTIQLVDVPLEGYRFSLPLTDEEAPNIYVSATLLGPDGSFRQGYLNLPVEPSAFSLNVELKATPENAKPGDTLTIDLTVTDNQGQPVEGEFSMAVVDLAALALAGPNSEAILPAFYDIQPLGVRTGLTAAISASRLMDLSGGRGGGGGAGPLTIRDEFPDTALWKADLVTNAQGKAQMSLTLPDSLTTWQIESRGLTRDTKVGQATVRVVTSKELLIRPQTPRFLVVGDQAELAAIVNNNTAQPLDATVGLQVTGFSLDDPARAEQKITIPANGRVRVAWTGLVQDGETVDPIFSVTAGTLQDAARPNDGAIPVRHYVAAQTFATAGILPDGVSTQLEIIALPRTFQPLGGDLTLELSPSLASVILESLKAQELPEDVWSTEQLLSYLLSNTATYQALSGAGLQDQALSERVEKDLRGTLARLLAAQSGDGGWPWAIGGAQSDPYLTAYILFGLQTLNASGLDLDPLSTETAGNLDYPIQRGREYLLANAEPLTGAVDITIPAWANQTAFYCFVLELTGGLNNYVYLTDNLYNQRELLDPWAKTLLAITLRRLSPTDERANTLFSDLEATALRSATGAHWESIQGGWMSPGSPLFTTAIVLYGLAERDPASPLAVDAVRYLAAQRGPQGWWASSYEHSWIVLALNRYMVATGDFRAFYNFSAGLNGVAVAQGAASGPENLTSVTTVTPLTQMNLNGANQLTISRESGSGNLYYRALLNVHRPVETAPALSNGLAVSREFLQCNGTDCQPVTSYQMLPDASGRIMVRVTVSVPNDVYYLMLEDFIPAGADIINSALKTSQQGEQNESIGVQYDESNPFGEGWGWWYFNRPQIYSDRIQWSADYLPEGTYVLTYTLVPSLAGEYRVLPARAWLAYFPEVQGTTAGTVFTIKGLAK